MGCLCKREFLGKPSLHAEDFTPSLLGKALLDILFIFKKNRGNYLKSITLYDFFKAPVKRKKRSIIKI